MKKFNFNIVFEDRKTKARVGVLKTPHGEIKTPAFVGVGTKATMKSLAPWEVKETGLAIFFVNTYHMYLIPGEEIVKKMGGLHKFISWDGPIITDSGGFQVFSLSGKKSNSIGGKVLRRVTENGVWFRSYLDGSKHYFSPEKSIQIQKDLGADIILCFDECLEYPSSYNLTKKSMERTHKWAERCLEKFKKIKTKDQALFGVIQGGFYKDLRSQSAEFIDSLPYDGNAIGGVSVGETKKEMRQAVAWTVNNLNSDKPRHLLGVGEIDDIFDVIKLGIDTFDCVIPTRLARTGWFFVSPPVGALENKFRVNIKKRKFKDVNGPVDKKCLCLVCKKFSTGYLHHLFKSNELLGYRLATYHNLFFINDLVAKIRESILKSGYNKLRKKWLGNLNYRL